MPKHAEQSAPQMWYANVLSFAGRWLLLVPEAVLLAALLSVYVAFNGPTIIGLLTAVLIGVFLIRTLTLHLGRLAIDAGQYRNAHMLISTAAMLYPWSADAQALRGTLALANGDAELAEDALRIAIQLMPDQPALHSALSSALLELGRPREAMQAAAYALKLDPQHAQSYLYLAEAERASGAAAQIVEERLRAGLATGPTPEPAAALQCALASHLIAERRYAEASLALHSAEALLPHCPTLRQAEIRYHLGELLIAQGQLERAREHFQGAEALDPNGRYAAAAWRAARIS